MKTLVNFINENLNESSYPSFSSLSIGSSIYVADTKEDELDEMVIKSITANDNTIIITDEYGNF